MLAYLFPLVYAAYYGHIDGVWGRRGDNDGIVLCGMCHYGGYMAWGCSANVYVVWMKGVGYFVDCSVLFAG